MIMVIQLNTMVDYFQITFRILWFFDVLYTTVKTRIYIHLTVWEVTSIWFLNRNRLSWRTDALIERFVRWLFYGWKGPFLVGRDRGRNAQRCQFESARINAKDILILWSLIKRFLIPISTRLVCTLIHFPKYLEQITRYLSDYSAGYYFTELFSPFPGI